jgi:hypothetical protein
LGELKPSGGLAQPPVAGSDEGSGDGPSKSAFFDFVLAIAPENADEFIFLLNKGYETFNGLFLVALGPSPCQGPDIKGG